MTVLEVRRLSAGIPGWDIVSEVSFTLPRGSILTVLGPNGAGKTTLVRAMLGLIPHRGEVLFKGRDLQTLSAMERAQTVAYVPQRSRLAAELSACEVVELGRYPHRGDRPGLSAADRAAVEAALAATDCRYLASRPFVSCSGGEQARLLIARALATEADCLVLDEPNASLDIAHTLELFALLRRLADQGRALLVVLHHLADALRWADNALVLHQGRCVALGPVAEVLTPTAVRTVYGVNMWQGQGPLFALPTEGPP